MEEKILNILSENSSELDDIFLGDINCLKAVYYPDVSKEIASHFKSFIEWCISYSISRSFDNEYYAIDNFCGTLDELYNYWLKEVKK